MFCPNCGKQIPERAKFCPECGHDAAQFTSIAQETTTITTQNGNNFPELKKLKTGYITIAVSFILGALICIGVDGYGGFLVSLVVMIVSYLIGAYFVSTANKAAKMLPSERSEEFTAFVKKWFRPTNLLAFVYPVACIIKLILII